MADEPESTAVLDSEPEVASSEPEAYTREEIAQMAISDFLTLHPQASSHIQTKEQAAEQRALEKALPEKIPEVREMLQRESEDTYLQYIAGQVEKGQKSRLDYFETKEAIEQARRQRGQKAMERDDAERLYIGRHLMPNAKKWADKLDAQDHDAYEAIRKQFEGAPGADGVQRFIEAVQDALVDRQADRRKQVIADTAVKDRLGDLQPESPDVGGSPASAPRGRENWAWFGTLSLPERQRIKREERARYDRIAATA